MGIRDKFRKFSRMREEKSEEDKEEEKIRQYEQHLEIHGYGTPYEDQDLKRKLKWWQVPFYDMKSRILWAILLACGCAIVIPTIVYLATDHDKDGVRNFGSCDVNIEWRFKNEINQVLDTYLNLWNCSHEASACWQDDDTLQFKCYHSVPSAYQYYLNGTAKNKSTASSNSTKNLNHKVNINRQKSYVSPIANGNQVEMTLKTADNVDDNFVPMKAKIHWHSSDILNIQFTNVVDDADKAAVEKVYSSEKESGDGAVEKDAVDEDLQLQIQLAQEDGSFFYLRIGRDGKDETLFDSRVGPLRMKEGNESTFTIATSLPSKHFYGIEGGQGSTVLGSKIIDGVTSFGRNELPFYMVYEKKTDSVHGVLLETTSPFVAQVTEGPGIQIHFEQLQQEMSVNLKLFVGPTSQDVLTQFYRYMTAKTEKARLPLIPYWALGFHLCRNVTNGNQTMNDLNSLLSATKDRAPIPFDSDCISENLRTPFDLDSRFSNWQAAADKLQAESRHILLAQKLTVQKADINNKTIEMYIMDEKLNETYTGVVHNRSVAYYSVLNNETAELIREKFKKENLPIEFDGIVLVDNLLRHDNASVDYEKIANATRTKDYFLNSRIQANFSLSYPWGTVYPKARHFANSKTKTEYHHHQDVANVYGQESMKVFQMALNIRNNNDEDEGPGENENATVSSTTSSRNLIRTSSSTTTRTLITSSSVWTESFLHGGYNGLSLPFTWPGLRDGLSHVLRYFMFTPFSGIPTCGSYQENETIPFDQELCLRWFQVSLLLPFARSSYGNSNKNASRGPLDFNIAYQKHLIQSVKNRYAHTPYYYSLFYEYTTTGIPPILPVSFHHPKVFPTSERNVFSILDQFLIGPSLMAAPLVYPGTSRSVYFPAGSWYKLVDGEKVWENDEAPGILAVSALINFTPIFIMGGTIIPTLTNPDVTAEKSRTGSYTIIGTYPESSSQPSGGSLYVDDGVSIVPAETFHLSFTLSLQNFSMIATSTATSAEEYCQLGNLSTTISDLRIFGFPKKPTTVNNSVTGVDLPVASVSYDEELHVLHLKMLDINWCANNDVTLTWHLPPSGS